METRSSTNRHDIVSVPEGFVKIERRNFTSPMEKLDRQDNLSTAWHLPVIFSDAPPHAPKQQEDGVVLLDGNEFPASTFLNVSFDINLLLPIGASLLWSFFMD